VKEYTIYYTLDDDIITEKMIKDIEVNIEEIEQEVFERMDRSKFFSVTNEQGNFLIDSYLVRYVRIVNEKLLDK